MIRSTPQQGFTLTEILIVIALLVIFGTISMVAFQNFFRASALKVGTQEVLQAFTDARSSTLASENDTVFGVLVSSTSVTRFSGSVFTVGDPSNQTYFFEAGVSATGSLVTSGTDIVFTRLSGEPSATGTIYIRNDTSSATNTVVVHGSGLIE